MSSSSVFRRRSRSMSLSEVPHVLIDDTTDADDDLGASFVDHDDLGASLQSFSLDENEMNNHNNSSSNNFLLASPLQQTRRRASIMRMPASPFQLRQRANSICIGSTATNEKRKIPEFPKLSRSASLTYAPSASKNQPSDNIRNSNRRGSLVPVELRTGHKKGSHHPHHQQQQLPSTSSAPKSKPAPSTGSCDDGGWTPLGLEFFVAPLTTTQLEDEPSVQALNQASEEYEHATCEEDLIHVQQLLERQVFTMTPFLACARDSNLGVLLFRRGQTQEALMKLESAVQQFSCAIPIQDRHAGESIYLRLTSLLNYSRALIRHNQIEKCQKIIEDDIQTMVEEFTQHTKSHASYHTKIPLEIRNQILWLGKVAQHYIMGMVHQRKGNLDEALKLYTTFLTKARHDLGHSHVHVATLLYMKGSVLFEQRKLAQALLAQLAALRIHEKQSQQQHPREVCRIMYSISRTLHDKEEYRDALHMYQRTLQAQKQCFGPQPSIVTVTTMCNIARVHHIMGDVEAALRENEAIVALAQTLAQSRPHPFWANRLVILGNIYVETGQLDKAMKVFDTAVGPAGGGDAILLRADDYDVDSRLANSLHKAGLQHPCAATA